MLSRTSRRTFLAASAALPFAVRSFAMPSNPKWILLGTDKGKGIYRAAWNATTGEVGTSELAAEVVRPSYFAMHPTLSILYSANELPKGHGTMSSFALDPKTATLKSLDSKGADGAGTCYIATDPQGRVLVAANYNSGNVACCPLSAEGKIGDVESSQADHLPHGPMASRQDASHMHCTTFSPDGDFLLCCDLGCDAILIFEVTQAEKADEKKHSDISLRADTKTRAGSGPRHVAFHPNGRWLYCIHELDCTIDLFDLSIAAGKPSLVPRANSVVSTLASPEHLPGSTACELVLSDDGRFLYANTRGEDSLVVYSIDPKTGLLTEQQRLKSGGKVTRHIAFDPSRRWLLCAHQGSSAITVFAHDAKTGKLSESPKTFAAETPMFIQFV
jgi:6-phosphogluconolactonase